MNYEMEELLPIVGRLAERYTGIDSTSISYEKAEQFMGAVLYCIHEGEMEEENAVAVVQGISARQAYENGKINVERKVKAALELYHKILPDFCAYENPYLSDTFLEGLPQFFQRYDMEFEPQDTILTLDYPILEDLSKYTGIDKIYDYVVCIGLEQDFLRIFPESYVRKVLRQYYTEKLDMVDNICEVLLMDVAKHIFAQKPLSEQNFQEPDWQKLQYHLKEMDSLEMENQLSEALKELAEKYCENPFGIVRYLKSGIHNVVVRLKNFCL